MISSLLSILNPSYSRLLSISTFMAMSQVPAPFLAWPIIIRPSACSVSLLPAHIGEILKISSMDNTVASLDTRCETVCILQIASMCLALQFRQLLRGGIVVRQAEYLVARSDQFLHDG